MVYIYMYLIIAAGDAGPSKLWYTVLLNSTFWLYTAPSIGLSVTILNKLPSVKAMVGADQIRIQTMLVAGIYLTAVLFVHIYVL